MSPQRTTPTRHLSPVTGKVPEASTVRVATYRRASTDEANQPYTLDAQENHLRHHIASQPGWVHAADFVERASGKDIDGRPQLQRLLAAAAEGAIDVVLVAKLDRWSSRLVDVMTTVEYLAEHDVAFKSATEPFDTGGSLGKLMLQMLAIFAEFERALILERIRTGIAAKLAKGIPLNSRVGYGLTLAQDGRVVADPSTFGTVRRIFDAYVTDRLGTRAIAIAIALNHDAIPGPGRAGWSASSVARVLRNRTYIGDIKHKGDWLPGAHDALLPVELFTAAAARLDHHAHNPAAAAASRGEFLLTGTVWHYYSCGTARRYGAERCAAPNLPAPELETLIVEALLASYADTDLFTQAITAHLAARTDRQEPLTAELDAVTAAIASKGRVRARYQADYESGELSAARYETRAAELDTELAALRERASDLRDTIASTPDPTIPTAAELAALHDRLAAGLASGPIAVRRALATALIETIDIHDTDDIRPVFRLYDPTTVPADQNGRQARGEEFAHRASGWSWLVIMRTPSLPYKLR
ncbi:MAG: recombinase family protein [Actinomycetes bacterium]